MINKSNSIHSFLSRRKVICGLVGLGVAGIGTELSLTSNSKMHFSVPASFADQKPKAIKIAWPKSEEDSLLTVAYREGFFNQYALDVQLAPSITSNLQAIECLKQGVCDAAVLSVLDWLPILTQGLPAKLLVGVSGGSFRLLVSRHRRMDRLADLSGLTIATCPNAEKEKLFLSILLRRKGLDPDQNIKWISIEEEKLLPALLAHQVDGIIGHDPLMWRLLSSAKEQVYELAGSQSGSWSMRVSRTLGIRQSFLNQNPEVAAPLAMAIRKASDWQAKHLKETSQLLANQWKKMTEAEILSMLQNQNQRVAPVNESLWEQVAQYIDELKLLNRLPNTTKSSRLARQLCLSV